MILVFLILMGTIIYGFIGGMTADEPETFWKGVLKYVVIWSVFLFLVVSVIGLGYLFITLLHLK